MKAVMLSVQPKGCELIKYGKKTLVVRKSKPKLEIPFKCYIYCTKNEKSLIKGDIATTIDYVALNGGKVIGEFVCDGIDKLVSTEYGLEYGLFDVLAKSRLSTQELKAYLSGKNGHAWHISDLVIYDNPKDPEDFRVEASNKIWSFTKKLERPPQSWCYVQELT